MEIINTWYSKLGREAFVTFMGDSVASRLQDPEFVEIINTWYSKLGREAFVTFMRNNSVASRLKDGIFEHRLNSWYDALGTERFVKIIPNGVAARLHVLDNVLPFVARNTYWSRKMTIALCKAVNYRQKNPVSESVAIAIYEELRKRKGKEC